jgi:hypothetical protein
MSFWHAVSRRRSSMRNWHQLPFTLSFLCFLGCLFFLVKGGWHRFDLHRFDFLHAFHVAQPSWSSARKVGGTDCDNWIPLIGFSLRFPSYPGLLSFRAIGGWHRLDLVGGTDWIFSRLSMSPRPPVLPRDWWVAPIVKSGWHRSCSRKVGGTDRERWVAPIGFYWRGC